MRATTVLGTVAAMFAMLLVPVTVANAATGDFAWGTVYADATKDGVITGTGIAGEVDKGVQGPGAFDVPVGQGPVTPAAQPD